MLTSMILVISTETHSQHQYQSLVFSLSRLQLESLELMTAKSEIEKRSCEMEWAILQIGRTVVSSDLAGFVASNR